MSPRCIRGSHAGRVRPTRSSDVNIVPLGDRCGHLPKARVRQGRQPHFLGPALQCRSLPRSHRLRLRLDPPAIRPAGGLPDLLDPVRPSRADPANDPRELSRFLSAFGRAHAAFHPGQLADLLHRGDLSQAVLPHAGVLGGADLRHPRAGLSRCLFPVAPRQTRQPDAVTAAAADPVLGRRDRAHLCDHDPSRQYRRREPDPEGSGPDRAADRVHVYQLLAQLRYRLSDFALHADAALFGAREDSPELFRGGGRSGGRALDTVPARHIAPVARRDLLGLHSGLPDLDRPLRHADPAGRSQHHAVFRDHRRVLPRRG